MDRLLKKLLVIGAVGLVVTWGTFIYLELTPQTRRPELEKSDSDQDRQVRASNAKTRDKPTSLRRFAATRSTPTRKPSQILPKESPKSQPPRLHQRPKVSERDMPTANAQGNTSANQFSQLESAYESETRDFVWADQKEKRILEMFRKGNYEETLINVSCRKTLCRMELKLDAPENIFVILKLPGFAEEVGINPPTKPVGPPDDLRFISFLTRK